MDFKEEFKKYTAYADQIVTSYLPEEEGFQKIIMESSNYSVRNGGKRLRPMLMMLSYELVRKAKEGLYPEGGELSEEDRTVIGPFMAAIEMIHCSSLVHDDLPCMDNDTLRRGKPSTWAKFGEDIGTLAGDALMLYAFETAAKSTGNPKRVIEAMSVLANKSGMYGMVGGQTVDVCLTGKRPTRKELVYIYQNKTGALLELSFMAGAILAGAGKRQVEALRKAALSVGLAFQIRDDILDVISTESELGKPIGSDEASGKVTWLTYYGMEKSVKDVEKYTEEAVAAVERFSGNEFLERLIRYLAERKN